MSIWGGGGGVSHEFDETTKQTHPLKFMKTHWGRIVKKCIKVSKIYILKFFMNLFKILVFFHEFVYFSFYTGVLYRGCISNDCFCESTKWNAFNKLTGKSLHLLLTDFKKFQNLKCFFLNCNFILNILLIRLLVNLNCKQI